MRDWDAFVRARLRLPGLTPERESRIVRELAAQLEDFCRDALAGGATDAEADAHAARQVADWERMAQDVVLADRRHARSRLDRLTDHLEGLTPATRGERPMLADLLRDARHAIRHLTKTPGFALAAVLTLGLGIGATSAIFSVVNGVVLRPLPYPQPESLMMVWEVLPRFGRFSVAPANFLDWRREATTVQAMAAFSERDVTLAGTDGPESIPGMFVSSDYFAVLGVPPLLGRGFTRDEDAPGGNTVVVVSHALWQRRFGGDRHAIGRGLIIDSKPAAVVGVMPRGFIPEVEVWQPLALDPVKATRGGHYLGVVARATSGTSLDRVTAEMKAIAARLATQYPSNTGESVELVALHDQVVGRIRPALLTLLAAVTLIVLIACANVANLLLVRASVRQKEMAIRGALGAGRGRLIRQMLVESLVLALTGGALGLALAYLGIRPIQILSAGSIPRVMEVAIDPRVLGFALVVSMLTGVIFGLAPAWQAARTDVIDVLKDGGRSGQSTGGRWMRTGLLVGEVALSMVLLVGAALLVRSFANATSVDPGFRAERVLSFRVALPRQAYTDSQQVTTFFDTLTDRLSRQPGVRSVGLVQTLPMRGDYYLSLAIEGRPPARPGEGASANYRSIGPQYFRSLGIPLLRGRAFTPRDVEKAPLVAIVDEAFVRRHFPDEDPIGRGIDIGNGTEGFAEIVGVVGNVRHDDLVTAPSPTMYAPFPQDTFNAIWVLVEASGDPRGLMAEARLVVRALDPTLPAASMRPLVDVVSDSVAQRRFSMLLLGLFAAIALCLAAVGLYGVVAYGVNLRTQEIGIRMAIGADGGDVLRMIVGGGMKLALAGVALGLAGALALSGVLRTMLYDVTPFDLSSYALTALVLLAVAGLACYIPARRATQLDPLRALRHD